MNPEDKKNQLQMFGMIVRDKDFFKKADKILEQFKIKAEIEVATEKEKKDAKGQA